MHSSMQHPYTINYRAGIGYNIFKRFFLTDVFESGNVQKFGKLHQYQQGCGSLSINTDPDLTYPFLIIKW